MCGKSAEVGTQDVRFTCVLLSSFLSQFFLFLCKWENCIKPWFGVDCWCVNDDLTFKRQFIIVCLEEDWKWFRISITVSKVLIVCGLLFLWGCQHLAFIIIWLYRLAQQAQFISANCNIWNYQGYALAKIRWWNISWHRGHNTIYCNI